MRVTDSVHRFINYVKQYEECDPAEGEIPLSVPLLAGNCEPDNLSYCIWIKIEIHVLGAWLRIKSFNEITR